MDEKSIVDLRKLLLWLHAEQEEFWPLASQGWKESTKPVHKVQELLGTHWVPIGEEELEKWLRPNNHDEQFYIDFSDKRKVLYLPPLEKNADFVPVLSLKMHLKVHVEGTDEKREGIKVRVMLVRQNEENVLQGIGFRLESPHGDEYEGKEKKQGRHDFYHAQFIYSLGWGPPIESPEWLPVHQPSFPLTADDPVTLVLSLLLTLYGKKYCDAFIQSHSKQLPVLGSAKRRLQPWIQWEERD